MKIARSLLVLIATIGFAHAGGFGGPPPFTGGSPLVSGIDGTYQAVATATNLTGIFGFTIQDGVQTQSSINNSWIFFIDGNILSGSVAANISNDKVAGVLDPGLGTSLSNTGTSSGADIFVIPGNAAAGFYNGTINLNSPIASFSGTGSLQGTPERTDQIVTVTTGSSGGSVDVTEITIPGSDFDKTDFTFRGTRLSISSITVSGTN